MIEQHEIKEIFVKLLSTPINADGEPSRQVARALFLPQDASFDHWISYSRGSLLLPYLILSDYDEFLKSCNSRLDAKPSCTVHFCVRQGEDTFFDLASGEEITDLLKKAASISSNELLEAAKLNQPVKTLPVKPGDVLLATTFYYPADCVGAMDFGPLLTFSEEDADAYFLGPKEDGEGLMFYPFLEEGIVELPDGSLRSVKPLTPGSPFPPLVFPLSDIDLLEQGLTSAAFIHLIDGALEILNTLEDSSFEEKLVAFGVVPLAGAISRSILV